MLSLVSTSGIQSTAANQLQIELKNIQQLNEQLASGQQEQNLTDYAPTTAQNLLNFQNGLNQSQSYISAMDTVQARLSGYNSSLGDMESIASTAQALAEQNTTYNPDHIDAIKQQVTNYLNEISDDLNQQVGDRYIYAGSRYSTAPVKNLSTLTPNVSLPFSAVSSPQLPSYDTDYAGGLQMAISGQTVTITSTAINTPQNVSVEVNGTQYTYAVQSGDTTTSIAAGLASVINASIPGTTSTLGVLTVGGSNPPTASTPDSNANAYAIDTANIDSGYPLQYGVTSNDPAFQQLIAGVQLMLQATGTTDPTTYQTDMQSANSLLQTAQNSLNAVNTSVAANINSVQAETSTQNSDITNLKTQILNLSSVDTATVSTEITSLTAQLDASYQATGSILQLSLVKYI